MKAERRREKRATRHGDTGTRGPGEFSSFPRVSASPRLRVFFVVLGLLLTASCLLPPAFAQLGASQGNSPLYSSRPYAARAPSGLPKALLGVGIDQKLNEQLALDLVFRNESGAAVRLGYYFDQKPGVLSLVYY